MKLLFENGDRVLLETGTSSYLMLEGDYTAQSRSRLASMGIQSPLQLHYTHHNCGSGGFNRIITKFFKGFRPRELAWR